MNIAIVTSYFYPWYGGITEHVYHQYTELVDRGYNVKIITPFDGSGKLRKSEDLIQIGKLVTCIVNGSVVKIPLLVGKKTVIRKILMTNKFDIVHLHQPLFCSLGLSFLSCILSERKAGRVTPAVVGTFHACGGNLERILISRMQSFFRRFRFSFARKIAVSQSSREFIQKALPGVYQIIPNGVDVKRFSKEKNRISRYNDGTLNILFVGRLEPRKGVPILLKSMDYIRTYTSVPFRMIIVGNSPFSRYYRSLIPNHLKSNVVFTGEVSFDELPQYYRTSHIFCSPALYGESFGIVLVEAMAAGLPVVATNNEGYSKVIRDGITGFLVSPQRPQALAAAIARLLDSEKLRKSFAERGRLEAYRYSWPKIVDKLENVYNSVA
jgi:phosphatidylinositol alpha-mannosyltransferase